MPDSLEVAYQRRLIEMLQRDGLSTHEAETRLRTMLDCLSSTRGYSTGAVDMLAKKRPRDRHYLKAFWPSRQM
jgi:hypothetical protein